jgi:outer membrane protein TolC
MEDLFLAALDVTLERHLFSPRPFAQTGVQYTGGQRDVDFRSALAVTNSVGVRQQLPYGGEVVAQALVDFVNALSDTAESGESAQLILSGTIPLLRGAGAVNLEPLIQAERDLVYEVRRFEDFRRSFAVQVATQYFRLLALQSAIANRRFNYVVLENLTEQTQALYGAGRINFLNVQRALQSQLSAENSLIDAEDAYSAALDNFKVLIGMPIEQDLEVTAVQLDVNVPDLEADAPELALKYRLDLQTQRDRIEDAQRDVQVARNGLLPDLDLTARGSLRNEDDEPARQIENDSAQYSVALNMDWPVDRLRERNVYRRSLIGLERAQRNFVQVRDNIIADVRDAVRNIRSAQSTLQIQQRAVDLAQRRLEYSNELLVQGRATDSRDVVEAQQSLLQAQDQFDRARAELQIQVLNFLRDTGILRVDPDAGALGMALNRDGVDPVPAPPPTN